MRGIAGKTDAVEQLPEPPVLGFHMGEARARQLVCAGSGPCAIAAPPAVEGGVTYDQMLLPEMAQLGIAVSPDRPVVPVTSLSGNVWTLDNAGPE